MNVISPMYWPKYKLLIVTVRNNKTSNMHIQIFNTTIFKYQDQYKEAFYQTSKVS